MPGRLLARRELPVVHPTGLRYLKERLRHEAAGDFVVEGQQRVPVAIAGPAFKVMSLGSTTCTTARA